MKQCCHFLWVPESICSFQSGSWTCCWWRNMCLSLQTKDCEHTSVLTIFPSNIIASFRFVSLENKPACVLRLFCLSQCCLYAQLLFMFNGKTPPLFHFLSTKIFISVCLFFKLNSLKVFSLTLQVCDLWSLYQWSLFKDNVCLSSHFEFCLRWTTQHPCSSWRPHNFELRRNSITSDFWERADRCN